MLTISLTTKIFIMNAIQFQLTDLRSCINLIDESALQLQQVELFLTHFNSNYNYWFNVYKNLIDDHFQFSIRLNTIYGDFEIGGRDILFSNFYSLDQIKKELEKINRKINYLSIESNILELTKDRAFFKVMEKKLIFFLNSNCNQN